MTRKTGKVALLSIFTILAASLTTTSIWAGPVRSKVIYGPDNRLDLYQVNDSKKLELADSTVAIFDKDDVVLASKKYDLTLEKLGEAVGLCSNENYFEQPKGSFCTGFLVAPNVVLTAGHCITDTSECKSVKFVFNYAVKKDGVFPESVASKDVVGCKSIIHREEEIDGADFAVIELTRKITHHKPLLLNTAADLRVGQKIGVIGNPSGIPTKVAFGAEVRTISPEGFFTANLDSFGGNSGSPVFNEKTGLVEGILVRGEDDFVYDHIRGCRETNLCSNTGCRGEDVTLIEKAIPFIPVAE